MNGRNFMKDLEKVLDVMAINMDLTKIKFPFPVSEALANTDVTLLNMSVRSTNVLKRNRIDTVGQLVGDMGSITKYKGCGYLSQKEIRRTILELCYSSLSNEQVEAFWEDFVRENYIYDVVEQDVVAEQAA